MGGEYPLASASAAERSQADESIRGKRGQQVVLTFSGQVRVARTGAVFECSSLDLAGTTSPSVKEFCIAVTYRDVLA